MVAAITLKMLDPFGTGKLVLFQVTYDRVSLDDLPHNRYFNILVGLACLRAFPLRRVGGIRGTLISCLRCEFFLDLYPHNREYMALISPS